MRRTWASPMRRLTRTQRQGGTTKTTLNYLNIRGSYATQAAMLGSRNPIATMRRAVPVRKGIWGPYLWRFFHAIGYRLANVEDTKERCHKTKVIWEHTKSLIQFIPCPSCRKHAMTEYIRTKYTEPGDDSCDWYQKWAHQFHNNVNTRLRKRVLSWEDSVKISASLNALEQLQGYIHSINGWKYPKSDSIVASIKSIIETM